MTQVLRGRRVRLRPAVVADLPRIVEMRRTDEVFSRWRGEELEAEVAADLADDDLVQLVIVSDVGEVVGLIQFSEESDPEYRHAAIDLFVDPRHHRRGIGSDAITALVRHLMDERGHHRLTIDPAADNQAAIACYAKVGFTAVGVMREYEKQADGSWKDGLLMELVRSDLVSDQPD